MLDVGEAVPFFIAPALDGNAQYAFDSAAGRPMVMLFAGSGSWAPCATALALLAQHKAIFDDERASFFGVTIDPSDAAEGRIAQRIPGIRWFLDYDASVSRLYDAARNKDDAQHYEPFWLLLDSTLRVVRRAPIGEGAAIFSSLLALTATGPEQTNAPVLTVPRVFEPELCRRLIDLYEQNGGSDSGFMRQEGGVTVGKIDHSFKRRADYTIADERLRALLMDRIKRRLVPEIQKAFQFKATRIERWLVARYDGESGGFFRPHRDNTTTGTAHRNFACTINLNAEEYEGGELRFPEFGPRTYRAPTGGAVIFSCSLLHEALPVTRGKRYAFLPFLYDEEGHAIRARNASSIVTATALTQPNIGSDDRAVPTGELNPIAIPNGPAAEEPNAPTAR